MKARPDIVRVVNVDVSEMLPDIAKLDSDTRKFLTGYMKGFSDRGELVTRKSGTEERRAT